MYIQTSDAEIFRVDLFDCLSICEDDGKYTLVGFQDTEGQEIAEVNPDLRQEFMDVLVADIRNETKVFDARKYCWPIDRKKSLDLTDEEP